MLKYIDQRLDLFFEENSPHYHDFGKFYINMWAEIFEYIRSIEETMPREYENELARCRDLKNSLDYALEEGEIARMKKINEGKIEARTSIAKLMKDAGEPIEKIISYTGLMPDEIKPL